MRPTSASPRTRAPQRPSSAAVYSTSARASHSHSHSHIIPSAGSRQRPPANRIAPESSLASTLSSFAGTLPQLEDVTFVDLKEVSEPRNVPLEGSHQESAAAAARAFLSSCHRRATTTSDVPRVNEMIAPLRQDEMKSCEPRCDNAADHHNHSTILLSAVSFLDKQDYASAFRAFSLLEKTIQAVLLGSTTSSDRVAACRYFLNFGVCAATCGLHERAITLFERAKRIAVVESKDGLLLEACNFNLRVASRHATDAQAQDVPCCWLNKSSAEIAAEYYSFVNTGSSPPPVASTNARNTPNATMYSSQYTDLIASSLLSNTRATMQADTSPIHRTKLCVMVSRNQAAQELAWYFSTMEAHELRRPMEMRIKGEASIDGGYGGVTNDAVGVFFREVLHMAAHHQGTPPTHSARHPKSADAGVLPADHFYALGVLMVKCFVEGRSFAVLCQLLALESVAHFIVATASPAISDKEPLHNFRRWIPQAIAHLGSADTVVNVLMCDQQRIDQASGSKYASGLDWYWQNYLKSRDTRDWEASFVTLCPEWLPRADAMEAFRAELDVQSQSLSTPELQRLMFLWGTVMWSRHDVIAHVRRGVIFAASVLPDPILAATLAGQQTAEGASAPQAWIERSIVRLVQRTLCGGDPRSPCVSGKDIVGRLEFRGWGSEASEAPYMLCSWLHQATPQMAEAFLGLCTGMTALPYEHSGATTTPTSDAGKMPGVVVVPSTAHLYARTCFFTLYIPRWTGCSVAEVHACIDAAVHAYRHSAVMHEVDVA